MDAFEQVYAECRGAVERYIRFRIANAADAEDVMQEVFCAAVTGYATLRTSANARSWLIGIARNKCADYLRAKYRRSEVPLEDASRIAVIPPRFAAVRDSLVLDTLAASASRISRCCACTTGRSCPSRRSPAALACPSARSKAACTLPANASAPPFLPDRKEKCS